jgi:hypothetical protein
VVRKTIRIGSLVQAWGDLAHIIAAPCQLLAQPPRYG